MIVDKTKATPTSGEGPNDAAAAAHFDKRQEEALITAQDGKKPEQGASAAAQETEQRPEWLPEKFKSPEELAKAYAELERKLSSVQQSNKQGNTKEQPQAGEVTQEQAAQALAEAGLDLAEFEREYMETGTLSEESYQKIMEAKKVSREEINAYIEGQKARAQLMLQQVYSTVGGEGAYTEMVKWASQNLSEPEIDAYNKVVDSGDVGQVQMAVQGLHARFVAANGSEPRLVAGQSGAAQSDVFRSMYEVREAMSDPRYEKDPAFRQAVYNKLARSNI